MSRLGKEIEQIIRATESAGWQIGDLIVSEKGEHAEQVEMYLKDVLQPELEERGIDIEYSRLRSYYRVALRNPIEKRYAVSFTAAEEAGDNADRFKWYRQHGPKLSKRQVRRLRGDRRLDGPTAGPGTQEEQLEYVKQLAEDPQFLVDLLSDPTISASVTAAYSQVTAGNRSAARDRMIEAGFGGLERAGTYYDVLSDLTHILQRAKSTIGSLEELDHLSEGQIEGLLKHAKKCDAATQFIVSRLEGGTHSMDEELELLLGEG